MMDVTERFSNRVNDYINYRPKYPTEIIKLLNENIGFDKTKTVADIGAGTGYSTELFLQNGNEVFAIEPNEAMRNACKNLYGHFKKLQIMDGMAEGTKLEDASIDVILAGTAFHWFDREKCKAEFARILKSGGHIVLMWNIIKNDTDFLKGYENLLMQYATDYKTVNTRNVAAAGIAAFFEPKELFQETLFYQQIFDLEGVLGRLRSSSFVPKSGKNSELLQKEITQLFDRYSQNGKVTFNYDTKIYWC